MPEQSTIERAHKDKREGKSPSTQAGEFVREDFHHIHEGKHGARSAKQAIAIGLSKARRAGVKLPTPKRGKVSEKVRNQARRDSQKGHHGGNGHVSRQTHAAARRRTSSERSASAQRAVRTKGHEGLSAAGRKAARTSMSR
jgi:hypothetical protein